MSNKAKEIISAKEGANQKPSLSAIISKLKENGLEVEYAPEGETLTSFERLVALVGLQRAGEIDVKDDIAHLVYVIVNGLVIDGKIPGFHFSQGWHLSPKLYGLITASSRDDKEAQEARAFLEDITTRINTAYDELCGPAKSASAAR